MSCLPNEAAYGGAASDSRRRHVCRRRTRSLSTLAKRHSAAMPGATHPFATSASVQSISFRLSACAARPSVSSDASKHKHAPSTAHAWGCSDGWRPAATMSVATCTAASSSSCVAPPPACMPASLE
eukprot:scaffold29183_cov111-Isochrysis_galbana.AAC.2